MIDSKHLKLIVTVDKLGTLSKAAKELNLTQSALSHQLKKLEDYLGISVFHRVGGQLLFTEPGKELRDKAVSILEELESLESRMNEIKESKLARYIHGYSQKESQRLDDQATSVADFLHYDSIWEKGSRILEVGCGVGAQTEIIAKKNPESQFISIDISRESLNIAKSRVANQNIDNVEFKLQDVKELNTSKYGYFDHVFICFLLEHISNPVQVLKNLKHLLKPNGTITLIEGDHGSTFFYPENKFSMNLVKAQVHLQKKRGGNANIGRELYPLLQRSAYRNIEVSPRQIYVDNSKPHLVEGFIKNTFTAMIQGVSEDVLSEEIMSVSDLKKGVEGLLRTTAEDGIFSYTFFKAKAVI